MIECGLKFDNVIYNVLIFVCYCKGCIDVFVIELLGKDIILFEYLFVVVKCVMKIRRF